MKSEKWVVLLAFIVAAIITPTPDPINQVIIAGPVIVVYQIGVIAVLVSIARSARRKKTMHREETIAEKALAELSAQPEPAPAPQPTPAPVFEPVLAFEDDFTLQPVAPLAAATPEEALPPSVVETVATVTIEPETLAEVIEHPEVATTALPVEKRIRPVDGFTVQRRSAAPLQVPKRPTVVQPQPRPVQHTAPSGGFYLDGIIPTRNAAA